MRSDLLGAATSSTPQRTTPSPADIIVRPLFFLSSTLFYVPLIRADLLCSVAKVGILASLHHLDLLVRDDSSVDYADLVNRG